jgi:hypothetical protein
MNYIGRIVLWDKFEVMGFSNLHTNFFVHCEIYGLIKWETIT